MKRRLFTLAAALSLLILASVVVLWVRSHYVLDILGTSKRIGHGFEDRAMWSGLGRLGFVHLRWECIGPNAAEDWARDTYSKRPPGRYHAGGAPRVLNQPETLGFYMRRGESTQARSSGARAKTSQTSLHVPYWFLVLLSAVLPSLWAWRRWRRRNMRGFEVESAGAPVTAPSEPSSAAP